MLCRVAAHACMQGVAVLNEAMDAALNKGPIGRSSSLQRTSYMYMYSYICTAYILQYTVLGCTKNIGIST